MPKLDLSGDRYGHLVVVKEVDGVKVKSGERYINKRRWLCKCDCGNEITVITDSLRSGNTQSCGCIKPVNISRANVVDITGQRFGKLTVIRKHQNKKWDIDSAFWECQCKCGNMTIVSTSNLKSGNTRSCGCLQKEKDE